jgi:serine protease Do
MTIHRQLAQNSNMLPQRLALVLVMMLGMSAATFGADDLRERIDDRDLAAHWIYDDFPRAQQEAKQTGKPLLVLFRCVPCQCAEVLDDQVTRAGSELEALQQKFVCVRLVQMKGVDLNYFQFDRDLSFAVLFMNADGTIYGRYGTRATISRTEATHISLPSFKKSLERALEIHQGYPANKSAFVPKRAGAGQLQFAEQAPQFKDLKGPTTAQNCIHCHMAGEAELRSKLQAGRLSLADIWPYPLPENLGLSLDKDDGLLVKRVVNSSPAAAAGLKLGDELLELNGQPLLSQGDIQWVLHHLPTPGKLVARVRRGSELLEMTLAVDGDWRRTDVSWRDALNGLRPGISSRPISQGERMKHGVTAGDMALGVRYVFTPLARESGIRQGDIIVAADGLKNLTGEGDLLAHLRLTKAGAAASKLTVLRRGESQTIELPLK